MKQIIQDLKKGNTILEEVPAPLTRKGHVLIKTHRTLISLGTEKMLVEFGKGNLISKARQQPEKVKQVFDKIKSDGLMPTLQAVFNKLDEPVALGYCNAGEVIAIGDGVTEFKIGDRVASNGPHAEIVCVPKNLCALIPDNVSYEEAAFTVIGSIGLQGIRLTNPLLGETVVVIGLGLIGLITCQLLLANGCKVIGFDFDDKKVQLAASKGVLAYNSSQVEVVKLVEGFTSGYGADAVIITASTKSNDVISSAAQMSRKRGRIILVGVIGLNINRADFYKKELTFQVSCSYGPGRYDDDYELKGIDYPLPFVRWTQKRNFEAVLQALSSGKMQVKDLITERVQLNNYLEVYNNMGGDSIASIIEYPISNDNKLSSLVANSKVVPGNGKTNGVVGVIGAGNFTRMQLLPSLKKTPAHLKAICSAGGLSATSLANKFGFEYSTTDYKQVMVDNSVDLVVITTRPFMHAPMLVDALKSNKHVFVEKPLAINKEQLQFVKDYVASNPSHKTISVGYNRRFSPFIAKMKSLIGEKASSLNMIATMNAGYIPAEMWMHDMNVAGGRIISEACHYFDLMIYLSGSRIMEVFMSGLGTHPSENTDNAIITVKFENGAQGVINYFSNGSKAYSKERIEVFADGKVLICDNFRKLYGYSVKGFSKMSSKQDKGHDAQFKQLIRAVKEGLAPIIPLNELLNSADASIASVESMRLGKPVKV